MEVLDELNNKDLIGTNIKRKIKAITTTTKPWKTSSKDPNFRRGVFNAEALFHN